MANEYRIYRAEQVQRALTLLRETIEQRLPPDAVIDQSMDNLELEVTMLMSNLKEKEK